MLKRPLIPYLLSFIGGILIGHVTLHHSPHLTLPLLSILSFTLIAFLLIPDWLKFPCSLLLFSLTGMIFTLNTDHDSDFLPLAREGKRVVIQGTVLHPARIEKDRARVEIRAERLFLNGKAIKVSENIRVTIYKNVRNLFPGERILFPARLREFRNFNNPGRYNYKHAMRLHGLSCGASIPDGRSIVPMGKGHLGWFSEMLEDLRGPVRTLFGKQLSPQNQALFSALVLGEKQGIDSSLRETFNRSGVGHILAVSGLHIGLVAWLTFFLSKSLLSFSYSFSLRTDIRKPAAVITCIPVIIYTAVSGFQVSGQRAMIMVCAYLVSILLGREKEVWSTLACAAFAVLALEPEAIFSVSFQLSFIAVSGILWLGPPFYQWIPRSFESLKKPGILNRFLLYVSGLIVVTLSAVIILLPITSFYFHRIPLVSVPANLLTVPILGFCILPVGLLSSLVSHISPSIAGFLLQAGAWGLDTMMYVIRFWSRVPGGSFWVVTPNLFEILLFYGSIFFIFFLRDRRWAKIGLCLTLLVISADCVYWIYRTHFNQELKVTYFDVGQGSSALIQFPGNRRMLVDGGGFPGGTFDVGRMVIAPSLWHMKIGRIDYLVLSHPQADHMDGLRFIASHFNPREFWYNGDRVENRSFQELMGTLASKGIRILLPHDLSHDRDISGVRVRALHPRYGRNNGKFTGRRTGLNDNSLVLKVSFQGISLLFPGDLEAPGEDVVVTNSGTYLKSHILLVPHHGSKGSCSKRFLDAVRPELCVISSGRDNYFGFPHPETLDRLKEMGSEIIQIDQRGAVQLSVDHNHFKVDSFIR